MGSGMRKLLYNLGLVKLVWFRYGRRKWLRIVWYGRDGRYVKKRLGDNDVLPNPKFWFELLPEGKLKYLYGSTTADYIWEVYKPLSRLGLSPFSFLKRNRAVEVKLRLE
jgi:hypothetical protein